MTGVQTCALPIFNDVKYKQPLNQTLVTPESNSGKVIVKCQQSGEIFDSWCLKRLNIYLQIPIKYMTNSLFSTNSSLKTVYNGYFAHPFQDFKIFKGLLTYHIHNYVEIMQLMKNLGHRFLNSALQDIYQYVCILPPLNITLHFI